MKNLAVLLMVLVTVPAFAAGGDGQIGIGSEAKYTDVKMLAVNGEKVSLTDVAKDNGLLVLFSCTTCPFVVRWEDRYHQIKEWADKNDVGMIVLNSNYKNRDGVDSFEEMKKQAENKDYNFYYVVDEESRIANAFGGQTTPHAFLFDGNMKLAYKGAIDDNYKNAAEVKKHYLKDAIVSLSNGEGIAVAETQPVGCSIKRKID
ncbi:MAG TPA: redoxin domain-containing protein [Tangfeifania sp.]|nr:redoxin domain-containing protein [Tangfeifania sp.]